MSSTQSNDNGYLIIGGSKVFVNEGGNVSRVEALERVHSGPDVPHCPSLSAEEDLAVDSEDQDSVIDDYIQFMEENESDEELFNEFFKVLRTVGQQDTVEDILGCESYSDDSRGESCEEDCAIRSVVAGPSDASTSNQGNLHELQQATHGHSKTPVNQSGSVLLWNNQSVYGRHKREKKKKVKDRRIARALSRGFSLGFVDEMLQAFVKRQMDMYAFPNMSKFEISQVRKLAHLYGCRCTVQGKGGKNIVLVHRTKDSGLPTGDQDVERIRMFGLENTALEKISGKPKVSMTKPTKKKRAITFVSSGCINPDQPVVEPEPENASKLKTDTANIFKSLENKRSEKPAVLMTKKEMKQLEKKRKKDERRLSKQSNTSSGLQLESHDSEMSYASFEKHTVGIGSKLLTKWGYEKGSGLGRKSDGIAEPIKVISRPKGLGLGA